MNALLRPRDTGSLIQREDPCSPPRYVRLSQDYQINGNEEGIRKGYVPVMVGNDGVKERFMVPTKYMKHPSIVALLDLAADEFGYDQRGVIQIPVEPDYFRDTIKSIPSKKKKKR